MPSSCIFAQSDGKACRLTVDHLRERKTGPCFPLTVVRCAEHGHAYTLYPPGHVPWGRRAVAHVDPEGVLIQNGEICWQGTLFEAALDAAAGMAWVRQAGSGSWGSETWWGSQWRLTELALDVLGLGPEQSVDLRHAVAEVVGVATLVLLEQARAIANEPGFRSRGRAVETVLRQATGPEVLRRLLVAGHVAGRWGPPLWWESDRKVLRHLAFPRSGTDPPIPKTAAAVRPTRSEQSPPPPNG